MKAKPARKYLNVQVDDLQLGDRVRGHGRVVMVPYDHDTIDDYVMVLFERRGEQALGGFHRDTEFAVREDEE